MNRVLIATAVIAFGMAPSIGAACEYADDSWASAAPSEQMAAATPAPAASTLPPAAVVKTSAPKTSTRTATKTRTPAPEQKVAVNTKN
jgi:hypothetical protein